jgi:hypothetical protein
VRGLEEFVAESISIQRVTPILLTVFAGIPFVPNEE